MSKDIVGSETLDVMKEAKNYNSWLLSLIKPYLGKNILEAGAGTGNFSNNLQKYGELTLVDYDNDYVKKLQKKGFNAGFGDLEKGKFFFSKNTKFDSIVNLNVLEHIDDDNKVLRNFYSLLEDGGHLILLTPAHQFAYSKIDKNLGHFRRYEIEDLSEKLQNVGFNIIQSRYLNILGLFGWFVSGKVLRNSQIKLNQVGIFELISRPILFFEKLISFDFGLSVFFIAKKTSVKNPYKKVSIIIPVFNEEKTVREIIKKVKSVSLEKLKKEIIVVNDGSTDKTKQILSKIKGIKIINKKNGGKGSAIRSGLSGVTGDIVIIQDADLEYNPQDFPKLIEPILKGQSNVVYGSRLMNLKFKLFGRNQTPLPLHFIANKILTLFTNLIFESNLTDMETCYKAFDAKIVNYSTLSSNGFEIEPELTAYFLKRKENILEVPIKVSPRGYNEGKKIQAKDAFIAIKTLLNEKFLQ